MMLNIIKWLGTALIIIATLSRIFEYHFADLLFGFVGTSLWTFASYKEKDKPLFVVNIFIVFVLLYGLIK